MRVWGFLKFEVLNYQIIFSFISCSLSRVSWLEPFAILLFFPLCCLFLLSNLALVGSLVLSLDTAREETDTDREKPKHGPLVGMISHAQIVVSIVHDVDSVRHVGPNALKFRNFFFSRVVVLVWLHTLEGKSWLYQHDTLISDLLRYNMYSDLHFIVPLIKTKDHIRHWKAENSRLTGQVASWW